MPASLIRISSVLLMLICLKVSGQGKYAREIGFMVGSSYYLGELNQKHFNAFQPAVGFVYKTNYHKRLAWTQHLLVTRFSAADSLQRDPLAKNRNLHFRSDIVEIGTSLEINYFDFRIGSKRNFATPYLFFGFSAFYMNPKAKVGDNWVALQPLGTEGQNLEGARRYNLINFAIPLGAGFKINTGRLVLTVFSGMRKTFTDYLDDVGGVYANPAEVSPESAALGDRSLVKGRPDGTNTGLRRGNTNTLDWYNVTGVMITFKTNKKKSVCDIH